MKQLLLTMFISLVLSVSAHAHRDAGKYHDYNLNPKQIKKMDRKHTKYKAKKRNFKTENEYLYSSRVNRSKVYKDHNHYTNGFHYKRDRYRDTQHKYRQRGFSQWKRGWKLAYKYDRASFYDNKGYHYGYFNRQGYYFEGVFYRYDRYYSYKDRVRGKGLFGHHYYMPANSRYYGFYAMRY